MKLPYLVHRTLIPPRRVLNVMNTPILKTRISKYERETDSPQNQLKEHFLEIQSGFYFTMDLERNTAYNENKIIMLRYEINI